jgi:hypothetical protein
MKSTNVQALHASYSQRLSHSHLEKAIIKMAKENGIDSPEVWRHEGKWAMRYIKNGQVRFALGSAKNLMSIKGATSAYRRPGRRRMIGEPLDPKIAKANEAAAKKQAAKELKELQKLARMNWKDLEVNPRKYMGILPAKAFQLMDWAWKNGDDSDINRKEADKRLKQALAIIKQEAKMSLSLAKRPPKRAPKKLQKVKVSTLKVGDRIRVGNSMQTISSLKPKLGGVSVNGSSPWGKDDTVIKELSLAMQYYETFTDHEDAQKFWRKLKSKGIQGKFTKGKTYAGGAMYKVAYTADAAVKASLSRYSVIDFQDRGGPRLTAVDAETGQKIGEAQPTLQGMKDFVRSYKGAKLGKYPKKRVKASLAVPATDEEVYRMIPKRGARLVHLAREVGASSGKEMREVVRRLINAKKVVMNNGVVFRVNSMPQHLKKKKGIRPTGKIKGNPNAR